MTQRKIWFEHKDTHTCLLSAHGDETEFIDIFSLLLNTLLTDKKNLHILLFFWNEKKSIYFIIIIIIHCMLWMEDSKNIQGYLTSLNKLHSFFWNNKLKLFCVVCFHLRLRCRFWFTASHNSPFKRTFLMRGGRDRNMRWCNLLHMCADFISQICPSCLGLHLHLARCDRDSITMRAGTRPYVVSGIRLHSNHSAFTPSLKCIFPYVFRYISHVNITCIACVWPNKLNFRCPTFTTTVKLLPMKCACYVNIMLTNVLWED